MTTCHTLSEKLVDLVQGELPSDEAAMLRAHSGACAPCASLLAREETLTATLCDLPPIPDFTVPEPVLPLAPILELPSSGGVGAEGAQPHGAPIGSSRRTWSGARLSAAVALVSAAALLLAVQLSGGLSGTGFSGTGFSGTGFSGTGFSGSGHDGEAGTAAQEIAIQKSVPVQIHTVLASESTVPTADDHFLALTSGVEAVVMRRPAQDRCANGLCASGR